MNSRYINFIQCMLHDNNINIKECFTKINTRRRFMKIEDVINQGLAYQQTEMVKKVFGLLN